MAKKIKILKSTVQALTFGWIPSIYLVLLFGLHSICLFGLTWRTTNSSWLGEN